MPFIISRSDGVFYAGTRDKKADWTGSADHAAEFREWEEARSRRRGLEKEESQGHTFTIREVR
jgi:hypothetical protein